MSRIAKPFSTLPQAWQAAINAIIADQFGQECKTEMNAFREWVAANEDGWADMPQHPPKAEITRYAFLAIAFQAGWEAKGEWRRKHDTHVPSYGGK